MMEELENQQECDIQESCEQEQKPIRSIWVISYRIKTEPQYRGVAIVKATDAQDAERTFLSESQHNAVQNKITIVKLSEVKVSYESMLLAEEYYKVVEE